METAPSIYQMDDLNVVLNDSAGNNMVFINTAYDARYPFSLVQTRLLYYEKVSITSDCQLVTIDKVDLLQNK